MSLLIAKSGWWVDSTSGAQIRQIAVSGATLIDPDTPAGQQPEGLTGRTLIMSEEFNGTLIDTDTDLGYVKCRDSGPEWSCWYPDWDRFNSQSPGGNHTNTDVDGYYQRNRVALSGGSLVLSAQNDAPVSGLDYSLGMLQSLPGLTISAGTFVESRVRMSAMPPGIWPAAWTACSDTNDWPPEIDYFEGNSGATTVEQNVYNQGDSTYLSSIPSVAMTEWHTYACDWTTNTIQFYMDGVATSTATRTLATDQYLLFDLAVHSGATFTSANMQIDYIRVWG